CRLYRCLAALTATQYANMWLSTHRPRRGRLDSAAIRIIRRTTAGAVGGAPACRKIAELSYDGLAWAADGVASKEVGVARYGNDTRDSAANAVLTLLDSVIVPINPQLASIWLSKSHTRDD